MSRRTGWWSGRTGRWGLVAGGVVCLGIGCAQLDPRVVNAVWPNRQGATDAETGSHRSRFQIDRDPESLNWLLAREVHNGMSVAVNEVLGESGEEVEHAGEMKRGGGQYQQTDVGYKWGPDTNGRSVVLFFREGKLVNFDPEEFR
jgi:hypothetical protein